MNSQSFDIIIIGAGPAGCICALNLVSSGLRVAVFEKSSSFREKICGDSLSPDVFNQLYKLSPELIEDFQKISEKIPYYGFRFFSPNGRVLEHLYNKKTETFPPHICRRKYFDEMLAKKVRAQGNISFFQNTTVTDLKVREDGISVITADGNYSAKMIIGADGAQSVVSKQMLLPKRDNKWQSIGIRAYFENVTGFHEQNYIELYYIKEIIPGYIWLFPMAGNIVNVGIGMFSQDVKKNKIKLKKLLEKVIREHPQISPRFANARQLEKYEARGIPLCMHKRSISGNRFLLCGDAASLVNPLNGEGIGNAMRSGRIAAMHIIKCFQTNTFSKEFNKDYDREVYKSMWKEHRFNRTMQFFFRRARFINLAFKIGAHHPQVYDFVVRPLHFCKVKVRGLFIKSSQ